jgi:hypothetical protein
MDSQAEAINEQRLRKMDSVDGGEGASPPELGRQACLRDKACSFEISSQIREQVTFRY